MNSVYVLTAVVVLFSGVTVLNLVLTVGLVRRMRQDHAHGDHAAGPAQSGLQPGAPAPLLSTADAGEDRRVLLAFFSTDCSACPEHLPGFRDAATAFGGAVLAVLSGRAQKYGFYESELDGAAELRYERGETPMGSGPTISAFGVRTWPSYFLLDADGTVTAVGLDALERSRTVAA